jgi:hypothetical protein
MGSGATLRCSTLSPKGRRFGPSSPAARVYGGDANRTTMRSDRFQNSLGQGKRAAFGRASAHDVETARDAAVRHEKVGCAPMAFARAGRMGASRCPACSREQQVELPVLKIKVFDLLLECAWRLGHGGARVCRKKTRLTRPVATHERMQPCQRRRGHGGP